MLSFNARLLQPKPILLDGATGTYLQNLGLPLGQAPELWNLTQPDFIKQHHQSYVASGAEVILTNTFGGNRLRLGPLATELTTINQTAVYLARTAAQGQAWVFGDVGPLGLPMSALTFAEAVAYFREQMQVLVMAGVDGLLIETLHELAEAQAAITAAQFFAPIPLIVTLSFDTAGRTFRGVTPTEAMHTLWPLGITAIGVNCGQTVADNLAAIVAMRIANPTATLVAKPNAGLPQWVGSVIQYSVTPAMLAHEVPHFMAQDVKLLGGCCGTTPAHIAAMKAILPPHE